ASTPVLSDATKTETSGVWMRPSRVTVSCASAVYCGRERLSGPRSVIDRKSKRLGPHSPPGHCASVAHAEPASDPPVHVVPVHVPVGQSAGSVHGVGVSLHARNREQL